MLNNKKVYAIIPVRGGSKGIPRKNLYRLGRDTLLERAIKQGLFCEYVDQVVVSTDDPEMYEISRRHNVQSPTIRPPHLATDSAKTVDVILHLLQELNIQDGYVLLLQATSPLRTLEDMTALFKKFAADMDKADAIVSLAEHDDPHPNKIQKVAGGYVASYLGGESMVSRQSLPKVYRLNGAFYLTSTDILKTQQTFMPAKTLPFVMPRERSVNLDSPLDIYFMEMLIEKGIVALEEYDDIAP